MASWPESWLELQIRITQLEREGSPAPDLRLAQAKLSRNSNQIARGRIRQFESYMPSHAVSLHRHLQAGLGNPRGYVGWARPPLKTDPSARADDQDCRHGVMLPVGLAWLTVMCDASSWTARWRARRR
jgi:hypothetical protein